MRFRPIFSVLGILIAGCGLAMLAAIPFSLAYGGEDAADLVASALFTIGSGVVITGISGLREGSELRPKDAFLTVTLTWILVPLFGALPFFLGGAIPSFTDAYFESVSGFTTTGASILSNVEIFPRGLLFWRALTHWMGGMGIIVLALAVLPYLGIGGMQLFKAEVAGPSKDKLTPRLAETARLLWGVYVLLTVVEAILLMAGGLSFYDALCHSFATIASGGFSTRNASIGAFHSPYVDWVVTIFMFFAGTNFALHYSALRGRAREYLKNDEFRFFVSLYLLAVVIVTIAAYVGGHHGDLLNTVRYSAFNVMSVMSTTGFSTTDFARWAPVAQLVIFVLLFPGGCAGSTAGAMKNLRVLLSFRTISYSVKRMLFPKVVAVVRYNGRPVEQETLGSIAGFVVLYVVFFLIASLLVMASGLDLVSSCSAVATCMAGCGPGLGAVGPASTYVNLAGFAKWVLDACMLVGRLEIFTIFILFSSAFWRR